MKTKRVATAFFCGIMILGLTACGAANGMAMDSAASTESYSPVTNQTAWTDSVKLTAGGSVTYSAANKDMAVMEEVMVESEEVLETGEAVLTGTTQRKVIRTATLNLQTLDFDAFTDALDEKMAMAGAYLQYADVSGSEYSGGRRSADYTIRVPESSLDDFLTGIEGIATVTNKTLGEQDVTLDYVDMESRVKTLEIEQERLLELLEKADDLDSIIKLEERLSEVRYSIESYQSKLRTYDDRITYSTVYIYVYEVTRVTEKTPETMWERIRNGWNNTMYDIADGAEDFVVWFVVNLPYLVFWAVAIVVLFFVLKKKSAKRKAKKLEKQRVKDETELDGKE